MCICENKEDIENNKKVIKVNTEVEKEEKEEKDKNNIKNQLKKRQTVQESNRKKLFLNNEQSKRNESNDKSTVYSIDKNQNISNSTRDNMLSGKLRSKIAKKTHGRRSVFLNRTSVNIIIVGDKEVGKTCYSNKLKDNTFNDKYIPTNITEDERFICKAINGERTYHLNIAIINNINDIKEELKRQIDYFLIFYDMNNENSIDFGITIFDNYLKSEINNGSNSLSHVIFIGNKCDLNNNINCKISQICDEFKINHFEISIKDNFFIDEMKNKLTEAFDNEEFQSRK